MNEVEYFTLHNARGQSILDKDLLKWRHFYPDDKSGIFGPIIRYSWMAGEVEHEKLDKSSRFFLRQLPDASGFICFESGRKPDNCLLLNSFGKEIGRLTVPWQMTRSVNPESAKSPTTFAGVGSPCINPVDGKEGSFGVDAWVEHAGMYYFELDYHAGKFLWGKKIKD